MIKKIFGVVLGCLVLFAACKDRETRDLKEIEDTAIKEFLTKNNLTSQFKKDSAGFYYQIIDEGNEKLDSLKNWDKIAYFHETVSINESVSFSVSPYYPNIDFVGYVQKPSSWNTVLQKLRKGGIARIITPSYLAYGKNGSGVTIPGNSILDTRLEVADDSDRELYEDRLIQKFIAEKGIPAVKDEESGVYYHILESGSGTSAELTSTIEVNYTGRILTGTIFDSGESLTTKLSSLISGWHYGVKKIKEGGKIRLIIPSRLAYGEEGSGNIRANTILDFDIELLKVTN